MSKLEQLCDELDMTVLIQAGAGKPGRGPRRYALGWTADPSAGVAGAVVTPWFASRRALETYCETSYEQIIEEGAPEIV